MLDKFWEYYRNSSPKKLQKQDPFFPQWLFTCPKTTAEEQIIHIFEELKQLYIRKSPTNIISKTLHAPASTILYVVGDIHGSFLDLAKLIPFFEQEILNAQENGKQINIIFLGDYVDRSSLDLHSLLYLVLFNLRYPKYVTLIRGNHEEFTVNKQYGFHSTVINSLSKDVFDKIQESFTRFPLVCIFNANGFNIAMLHGGIPLNIENPAQSINLHKTHLDCQYTHIEEMDPISQQILWNDPGVPLGQNRFFSPTLSRGGAFYVFGEIPFMDFLNKNHIDFVIRGHQMFENGYQYFFHDRLLSIFSNSEYQGNSVEAKICQIRYPGNSIGDISEIDLKLLDILDL